MSKKKIKSKIEDYIKDIEQTYTESLNNSIEDTDFYLNYQWKSEDKEAIESEGRPALTYNEIAPFVDLTAGIQAQNRQDIKVLGVEDMDDFWAEILTDCIKHIITKNNGEYVQSRAFKDGLIGARGYITLDMDYREDMINGMIELDNEYFCKMFVDPDSRKYDFVQDAEFVLQRIRVNRSKLERMFYQYDKAIKNLTPDSGMNDSILNTYDSIEYDESTGYDKSIIMNSSGQHANRPKERSLYTVNKVWHKEYKTHKYVLYEETGEFIDITEKQLSREEQKNIQDYRKDAKFLTHETEIPRVAYMVGNELIEEDISPHYEYCKTFPIVQYCPSHNPIGRTLDKVYQSFVRPLKDPQTSINKGKSQDLHIKNSMANGIWIVDKGVLSKKGLIHLEKFGSTPGLVLAKQQDGEIKREYPGGLNTAYSRDEQEYADVMKRVRGISPDMLGMADKTVSGTALEIRRQQGLTAMFAVLDNNKFTSRILGTRLVEFVLGTWTPEKILRVVGERKQLGNGDFVGKISYQQAEELLNNKDVMKYDIVLDEQNFSPTMRYAVNEQLERWAEKSLLPIPIIQESLLENSSINGKEKIKAKLKEYNNALTQKTQGGM